MWMDVFLVSYLLATSVFGVPMVPVWYSMVRDRGEETSLLDSVIDLMVPIRSKGGIPEVHYGDWWVFRIKGKENHELGGGLLREDACVMVWEINIKPGLDGGVSLWS